MRVTSVELHPVGSTAVCVLSFRDPGNTNPYNVREIAGLDAESIVPRYYGGSGSSAKFYNLSLEKRDIVARIQLNPRAGIFETPSSLRDDLYRLIASSRTGMIEIQFKDGETVVATVSGFVNKFESVHFDKSPEVTMTIHCDDPILRAPDPIDVPVAGLNPANTVISDLLSTAPHGFSFEMAFTATVNGFTLQDPNDDSWAFTVTPAAVFLAGDVLHLSSEFSDKHLYIVRGTSTIYIADLIAPGSVWPILFPGDNAFSTLSPGSMHWNAIQYRPTYWGV